jgi:anti-sigma regulatory factor (Ser/Thr protein kinase)
MTRQGPMAVAQANSTVPRTAGWPFQSRLELGALASAVPCARLHARQVLWEWGLGGTAMTAELVTSELVTNALRASVSAVPDTQAVTHVSLLMEANADRLVVQVWDGHPDPPVRGEVDQDAESGRGLLIVEAVCDDWGWYWPDGGMHGKWVWAAIQRSAT